MPRLSALGIFGVRGSGAEMPLLADSRLYIGNLDGGGRFLGFIRPATWAASNWVATGGGISNQPVPSAILDGLFHDTLTGIFWLYFAGNNANIEAFLNSKCTHFTIGGTNYALDGTWGTLTNGSGVSTLYNSITTYTTPALTVGATYDYFFGAV